MAKFEIIAVLRLSADKTAIGGKLLEDYALPARQMQVGDLTIQILGINMLAGNSDVKMQSFTVAGAYPEEMLVGKTALLT